MHSPKIDLILCIKTEPVTVGADSTKYVWFLGQIYVHKSQIYNVASAPAVTGSVFIQIIFDPEWCFQFVTNLVLEFRVT